MGAMPWFYVVPYDEDIGAALYELRRREFLSGRYNPVIPCPEFPLGSHSPSPGPEHSSIEEAIEASGDNGTRSILDVERLSDKPNLHAVYPLAEEHLARLFGTTKPSRAQVEANMSFLELIDRGQGVYVVLYEGEEPSELLFAGYSFD